MVRAQPVDPSGPATAAACPGISVASPMNPLRNRGQLQVARLMQLPVDGICQLAE